MALLVLGVCRPASAAPPGSSPVAAPKRPSLLFQSPTGKGPILHLVARHLLYHPAKSSIVLTGQVVLTAGKTFRLSANRVEVALGAKGRPYRFHARGAVRFSIGPSSGQSGEAILGLRAGQRRLELQGQPRLRWAPLGLTLTGARIEVDLVSGALAVQQARACINSSGKQATGAGACRPARPAGTGLKK